jgi:hypothetical protein
MNNKLDEKDIQKLLAWKGSNLPDAAYFEKLTDDVMERIRVESAQPVASGSRSLIERFAALSDAFGTFGRLTAAGASVAALIMVGTILLQPNQKPADGTLTAGQTRNDVTTVVVRNEPAPESRQGLDIQSASLASPSAADIIRSPLPSYKVDKNDPRYPFGISNTNSNPLATSPWPRPDQPSRP